MNVSQALELATALFIPEFLFADGTGALDAEREKTEEAIRLLREQWFLEPLGQESFSFDLVRGLADRNRTLCDLISTATDQKSRGLASRLQQSAGSNLTRQLSDADLIRSVAALQHRNPKKVSKDIKDNINDLAIAYIAAPVKGSVLGIDLETTGINPDRAYIINVGFETMELTKDADPQDPEVFWCAMSAAWDNKEVPLERIHHINQEMLKGKTPFRENKDLQKKLLKLLSTYPFMAHNAAFEDSWLMLHLDGYAEGRKAHKIIPIDTRDICRRIDKDIVGLMRESHPAALENWARRRGTLSAEENERHLGLDDTDLMLRTVQAEFNLRNMFVQANPGQSPNSNTTEQQDTLKKIYESLASALQQEANKGDKALTSWVYTWMKKTYDELVQTLPHHIRFYQDDKSCTLILSQSPENVSENTDEGHSLNLCQTINSNRPNQSELANTLLSFISYALKKPAFTGHPYTCIKLTCTKTKDFLLD